jgi:ATP-dependent Clp protease ATP-binding subunit ClpA
VRAEIDRRPEVRASDVVSVISQRRGSPRTWCSATSTTGSRHRGQLAQRIIGQHDAVRAVAERLMLNKGPLKDGFDRPDGVLLFLGPTGVGRPSWRRPSPSTVRRREEDSARHVRISGRAAVDKLIGMPRGIVGSERGGVLTNHCATTVLVILLDGSRRRARRC